MRKTILNEIYKLAKQDKRVVFVGSDLGSGTLNEFKKEIPDRFFMEGISEQHLIGFVSGMALSGKIPYFNTIATFLTRRSFEQICIDVCMHNLPVRLIGSGGGLVYAPLGNTHLAIDDIALMRTIPNMTIVAPADAVEMERLMPLTLTYPGPMYIRLAKGGDEIVTSKNSTFRIGAVYPVHKGEDVLLLTTGITLQIALSTIALFQKYKINPTILHIPTVKPLKKKAILRFARSSKIIISIEEGCVSGGLGSAVAEILCEDDRTHSYSFHRIGIPDTFPDKYGTQYDLLSYFHITKERIVAEVLKRKKLV